MKKILIIILAVASFAACKTSDKKTAGIQMSKEEKDKVLYDSANYTTIQWLDSTYLDLGKVKDGKQVEVSFRFRNSGTKNLIITDVTASCGCTVPERPGQAFAPGQEGVIKAKFDSKGRPHAVNRKEVYVTANTLEKSHVLTFSVEITD